MEEASAPCGNNMHMPGCAREAGPVPRGGRGSSLCAGCEVEARARIVLRPDVLHQQLQALHLGPHEA